MWTILTMWTKLFYEQIYFFEQITTLYLTFEDNGKRKEEEKNKSVEARRIALKKNSSK